jgi:mRNA-degrading endonuclease RelE of RelBE toxin-antitoxin system
MPFEIGLSQTARRHLRSFKKRDRNLILDAITEQLTHQPSSESRARVRLRQNPLSTWELRQGDCRVFYEVHEDESRVEVVAIGLKIHNVLYIEGEVYPL